MQKKELRQYRDICRELEELEAELKNKTVHITVVGSDAEYPYTKHTMSLDGAKSSQEVSTLLCRLRKLTVRKKRIEAYIDSIDDNRTRRIFLLRYITGNYMPSWNSVAHKIGYDTADCVRMTHERYLKKGKLTSPLR